MTKKDYILVKSILLVKWVLLLNYQISYSDLNSLYKMEIIVMHTYKLTEKELLIIDHFVENESKQLDIGQNEGHFFSYPAQIERELNGKISRVHAKEICKKYEEMEILTFEKRRPPRQKDDTKYFFIKPGLETFSKIVRVYLENFDIKLVFKKFSQKYFKVNINEELLEHIFSKKLVVFPRFLDISKWEASEAQALLEAYHHTHTFSFNNLHYRLLKENKTVDDLLAELPDSDIRSFELYMKRKLERMDLQKEPESQFYPIKIKINFPYIASSKDNKKSNLEYLSNFNKETFEKYPVLKTAWSAFEDHYNRWQRESLSLPLLSLLNSSPSVLGEFLYGEWKLSENSICEGNLTGSFESEMRNYVFLALKDLTSLGDDNYPEIDCVYSVNIRPDVQLLDGKERQELLSYNTRDYKVIYFDFSMTFTSRDEGFKRLGVTFYDRGISYSRDVLMRLNSLIDSIKNFEALIDFLKDVNNPISTVLSNHLSYELKNYLKYCDPSKVPSRLKTLLSEELKHAFVREDWAEVVYNGFKSLPQSSQLELKNYSELYFELVRNGETSLLDNTSLIITKIETAGVILKGMAPSAFESNN
jgi:hypothetical protein